MCCSQSSSCSMFQHRCWTTGIGRPLRHHAPNSQLCRVPTAVPNLYSGMHMHAHSCSQDILTANTGQPQDSLQFQDAYRLCEESSLRQEGRVDVNG